MILLLALTALFSLCEPGLFQGLYTETVTVMTGDTECLGPISLHKFHLYSDTVSQHRVIPECIYSSLSPTIRYL
jgi:hypothetical protein